MRLDGQVAIITGVSHAGQAGFALATAFAIEGAKLAISARSVERVNARARELRDLVSGAQVLPLAADLTTEAGAEALVRETMAAYGRIDILLNLAGGLTKYMPSDELSVADWDAELNNNLRTTFLCTRAVWPIMKSQGGGNILNFSRAGGVEGSSPKMLAYNCAKAGVDALTRTFAKEGRNVGISVNAIGPGLLITQSNIESMKPSAEELRKKWVSLDQIAEAALFLVSEAGNGVNGVILPVQAKGI
jgi:NAD(P)-dependent dehydrogenase (short-subunit alcohol dehydrogenase family)